MKDVDPFAMIARGVELNPAATKILVAVPVLLACVALSAKFVSDTSTAVLGSVFAIVAAVILLIITSIPRKLLGALGVIFAKSCLLLFVLVLATMFSSWALSKPKPMGCLVRPLEACSSDFPEVDQWSESLRDYLFAKSGSLDQGRLFDVRREMIHLDQFLSLEQLLIDPKHKDLRRDLAGRLPIRPRY